MTTSVPSPIDVLAIGELLADVISQETVDNLSQARSFRMFQGGSPSNVCANLQFLGNRAVIASCVGQDGIGTFIVDELRRIGLDDRYIQRSRTHPTSIVLVGRSQGTPDFVAYRMADTQIAPVPADLVESASIVHSCAFALSREPARSSILEAFARASTLGRRISVDWNFAPSIWGDDDGKGVLAQVCAMRPLLKFSLDDAERFVGRPLGPGEAMAFLDTLPSTGTCLTCGKDGVWYRGMQDAIWNHLPALAVPEVKDATGAGDAFWAGFLHGYLRCQRLEDAVLEGLAIAARKIQVLGPLYLQAV